jgi:2-keto-4-pentenoate hydratase
VEAEFIFRMGADAPANKRDWTDAEALDLVEAVHIGVETAGSPMAMINVWGPTVVSSDFGNNFGVILGPEIGNWRTAMNAIRATTSIDGRQVGSGMASSLPGGPVAGLRFLLAHLAARGLPLKRGQLVSSGALTGVHDILPGQESVIAFEGCGQILCRAMAA